VVFTRLLATLCRKFYWPKFCICPPKFSRLFVFTAFGTSAFVYFFLCFFYIFLYFIYIFVHLLATSKLHEALPAHHIRTLQLSVRIQTDMSVTINNIKQTTAVLTDGAKQRNIVRRGTRSSFSFTTEILKLCNYSWELCAGLSCSLWPSVHASRITAPCVCRQQTVTRL
jgi:hypothetical protein